MISRLHPLLVHLPIGFIVLAFLLETYVLVKKPKDNLEKPINYIYLATIAASGFAIITGLLLARDGKFTPSFLLLHKWLAFAVLLISILIYIARTRGLTGSPKRAYAMSALLIIAVSVTGHYGGTLTHGPDYLFERAPQWLSKLAGVRGQLDLQDIDPDSVVVYKDIVQPILNQKCSRCHNAEYPLGGLQTTSYKSVIKGGEDLDGIIPGKPFQSGILIRPGLPVQDERFMPPDGQPLSQGEFSILKYWIEMGADSTMRFDNKDLPDELRQILLRDFNLDYTPRPHYMKLVADSLSPAIFEYLRNEAFEVSTISEDSYFLNVRFNSDTLSSASWHSLDQVAAHIIDLDLSNTHLVDSALTGIQDLENLVTLDLHATNVTDSAMSSISGLDYLEVLNVYNTPLKFTGLELAAGAPSLERLYVWQTGLKEGEENQLRQRFPRVSVVGASSLETKPDTITSADPGR